MESLKRSAARPESADVEAMFGAPVRVRPWAGQLTDGITKQDQCSADDGFQHRRGWVRMLAQAEHVR